jgi:hypothetical protein
MPTTTTTATRFALIELNSGYVWGCYDAASPEEAIKAADRDNGADPVEYERVYKGDCRTTDGGFAVYVAPAGYTVTDGQDHAAITAVEALPLVGYYRAA